jgi:Mg-chelatase subunit ChlD
MDDKNDVDIPVAIATTHYGQEGVPLAYAEQAPQSPQEPQATLLQKGRSSRVVVPPQQSESVLSDNEFETLKTQGYTSGLIRSILNIKKAFPLRIWVVDNSGSMSMGDGHRIVETLNNNDVRLVSCSRWTEIQETVEYHIQLAALLKAPTTFRLLNDPGRMVGPQQFSVAERGPQLIPEDVQIARKTLKAASPSGVTPLSDHLREIRENILVMQNEITQMGQKVVVVLATDGLPTDTFGISSQATRAEFETALRCLEGLPVWLVIRLCTDEDTVVDYYNNLDAQLELSLEVLDDFIGEAQEVYQHNNWLNYALPLHRVREMGFSHRLFDLLDERQLTVDEIRDFVFILFGEENFDGLPDPAADWSGFLDQISIIVHREKKQWNPVKKKATPWIDMKKLKKVHSENSCSIM